MERFIICRIILLAVAMLLIPWGVAQNNIAESVKQPHQRYERAAQQGRTIVKELMVQQGIPGLSVAVAVDEKIVWSEGFGFADLENRVPVSRETRFRVGSVSKLFTAAAVAQLFEKGQLDLDAPVQRYVPAFPKKGFEITTRLLAGHLAGIRHYSREEFINLQRYNTVAESLDVFKDDPLLHQPGTKYLYSSYGYTLISGVIEGAAKQDYLIYVQQRVFQPMNMRGTVADDNRRIIEHRARFYARSSDGQFRNEVYTDNSNRWAAGGFLSTGEDLVIFGSAHLKNGIFKPETLGHIFASQRTSDGKETGVGVGWRIGKDSQGRRIYHHGGESIGGRAYLIVYPDSKIVVALLANLTFARIAEQEGSKIAELFMN